MNPDFSFSDAETTGNLFICALDHFAPTTRRTEATNLYLSYCCHARGTSTIQEAGELAIPVEERGIHSCG